jgi:sugar phosphate isomerase/epimerase
MRFAICNETYQDEPLERVCEDVASCGYHGLEVAPFTLAEDPSTLTEAEAKRVGDVIRAAGLDPVGFHWLLLAPKGLHLTTSDDAVRQKTVEFVQHLGRRCADMGGKVMVWGSPDQRNIGKNDYEECFKRATDAVRAISEACGKVGVTVAMEPLSRSITDFLRNAEETIRLIEAVGHPACRLHLDVRAMSDEDKPIPQIIAESRKYIAHVHANDANSRGPGTGDVDFAPIIAALRDAGYDGYLSVEVFDYKPDARTIARESIEYLKRVVT